jgi:hypothetical protein
MTDTVAPPRPAPYRADRFKVLKGLVSLVRTQPIFLYQLVVFARYPSWAGAGMVFLGLVVDQLAVNIVFLYKVLRSRRQLISGCLDRMQGCTFERYPASDFLEPSVHTDIDDWYVSRMFRMLKMSKVRLENMVKIYVVSGPAYIEQLSCFYDPLFFNSYIFITDPPEDTHGVRRFFILHEIGHTQMALATNKAALYLWMWPYLFFVLWVALTATWNAGTLAIGAAYLCAMLVWSEEWKRGVAEVRALSELVADCFALGYLSPDELARVARNQKLSVLLDRDMSDLQNTTRLARLRENIELTMRGDDDAVLERTFSATPEPPWSLLLATAGLVSVVGLCGAPPTTRMVGWTAALVVVLLVWFLLLFVIKGVYDHVVEARLSGGAPAGQPSTPSPVLSHA